VQAARDGKITRRSGAISAGSSGMLRSFPRLERAGAGVVEREWPRGLPAAMSLTACGRNGEPVFEPQGLFHRLASLVSAW
jgi:hypothetical protein